jgi:hypothetical protein
VTDRLVIEINSACKQAHKEMQAQLSQKKDSSRYAFNAQFDCIIPSGGILHNNVLRLLIACGVENYSKSIPMAIFAHPATSPK